MRYIIMLFVLVISLNAGAQENHFYAGVNIGFTELDDDGMGDNQSFEENSGLVRIFAGYQFNTYLASELTVGSLGLYEGETPTADISNSYSALTLSLLGYLPLAGGVSLFAQGGGGLATNYQVIDGVIGGTFYDDEEESGSGLGTFWGAGLSYVIPETSVEIRLGYQRTDFEVDAWGIDGLGNLVENEYDQTVEQFYLGAAYHFK